MLKRIALLILFAAAVGFHMYSLDGIHGNLFDLIAKTDTQYAEGYTDKAFRKIERGQSKEEVTRLIGEPLSINFIKRKDNKNRELLWYSHSPSGSSYRLRTVELIEGKVSTVTTHFYID